MSVEIITAVLSKAADDCEQAMQDSIEQDRAYVNGTYGEWLAAYRQREVEKFMTLPMPGK